MLPPCLSPINLFLVAQIQSLFLTATATDQYENGNVSMIIATFFLKAGNPFMSLSLHLGFASVSCVKTSNSLATVCKAFNPYVHMRFNLLWGRIN